MFARTASTSPHTKRIEAGEATDLPPKTRLRYLTAVRASVANTITTVIQIASTTGLLGLGSSSRTITRTRMSHLFLKRPSQSWPSSPLPKSGVRGRQVTDHFSRVTCNTSTGSTLGGAPRGTSTQGTGGIALPDSRADFQTVSGEAA